MSLILVAARDALVAETLPAALAREGLEVEVARRGADALRRLAEPSPPGVLVADASLADLTPEELCRRVRQDRRLRHVRVVVTSQRAAEIERVVAFELGADDYVTKPFSMRELVLRLRAIARRARRSADPTAVEHRDGIKAGRLKVDLAGHRVWVDQREVRLTLLEFRLLATLLARRGRVEARARLLYDLWGRDTAISVRTVDTHVRHLRGKLGPAGRYVETVRGVGYRFSDDPAVLSR